MIGIEGTKFEIEISSEWQQDSKFNSEAKKQFLEYLEGTRSKFDLKLNPKGSEFQKIIWNELLKIPFGETKYYQEIAIAINKPTAARAVGMANTKNPIPIIIPCHRVIGKNGSLTGYAGGTDMKALLIRIEKAQTEGLLTKK